MTALHGFLGRPPDWDGVLGDEWFKPDWLSLERGRPVRSRCADAPSAYLDDSARLLNALGESGALLGYSMGGRIALHMLVQEPARWSRAIIVSASPGLSNDGERESRLRNDEAWAKRFRDDDWDAVVADWNAQGVFAYDPPEGLPRPKRDYDREALADALVEGSVARQADLRGRLRTLDVPILWIAGEWDAKYRDLAGECAALNPLFRSTILPGAGHRAPWGNSAAFRTAVEEFTTITP